MTRGEFRWAVTWAGVIMLLTCLPYLYAATLAPEGTSFSGLLYGAEDHCVYLAWEQQAAQGQFFFRNLFTGDPQRGIYLHLLSWLIGSVAGLTGLPLILVHHGARVLLGVLALVLAYRLFAAFTQDPALRRVAFWFTALSSGVGWYYRDEFGFKETAVDLWQTEAITFLSLYFNGLFGAALSLMLGIYLLLLAAGEKSGAARWGRVAGAGALGLLLGNIHSYDVVIVAGVWTSYLAARAVAERRVPLRALADALVAALLALPSTAYQYYLYRTEPVFRIRANDQTLSPPLTSYLLGYGLVLVLAVLGAVCLVRAARRAGEPLGTRLLLLVWPVAGFAMVYLPLAFQRRLIMGTHLPLSFLAAAGALTLARSLARRWPAGAGDRASDGGSLPGPARHPARALQHAVVAGLVLLTMPTNCYFVYRDIEFARLERNPPADRSSGAPIFCPEADLEAMAWAREHLPKDGLIFCSAVSGSLFPPLAGRPVYVGHWSETPHGRQRLEETLLFYRAAGASSQERRQFLEARRVRYVYQGPAERRLGHTDLARDPLFRPVYSNAGATLFELRRPEETLSQKDERGAPNAGRG